MIRFIMLGTGRTGSTVIANALADHPQVLFYGELFHFDAGRRASDASRMTVGAGVLRELAHGVAPCRESEDGAGYVERLYAQAPIAFRAVGFKLFNNHAREGANATVWPHIAALASLRIVHVKRENWLAALVSAERARRTHVWHTQAPPTSEPFRLAPEACVAFFERRERGTALAAPLLERRPVLEVEYADIVAGLPSCMERIWAFLEVDALPVVTPRTAKISRLDPREEIANYDELRERFRGTRYARFFP